MIGDEDEIELLKKTKDRFELANQGLCGLPKINFNHVFNEVRKENELLQLSKMLKSAKNFNKENSKTSFCT